MRRRFPWGGDFAAGSPIAFRDDSRYYTFYFPTQIHNVDALRMEYSALAIQFRSAFDSIDLTHAPGFLPRFPKGCCRWAAVFMGNYLRLVYEKSPVHVWARHQHGNFGHEWIEVDGIILDITLDQFDGKFPTAYAGELLTFHSELVVNEKDSPQPISDFSEICNGDVSIVTLFAQFRSFVEKNRDELA